MNQIYCTEFHLFPNLPPELRRAIWDYAVEEPRVVETCGFWDGQTKRWTERGGKLHVFPKFPPIYNVCHEARKAFVESSGLVSENKGLAVAWHPDRDMLKCNSIGDGIAWSWWDEIGYDLDEHIDPNPPFPEHQEIQNIQLELSTFFNHFPFGRWRLHDYGGILRSWDEVVKELRDCFPNIRTVELVADDEFSSPEEQRSFEVTLNFPRGPIDFSQALKFIKGLRDSCDQGFSLNIVGRMVCLVEPIDTGER